jgi:hypothetical protein
MPAMAAPKTPRRRLLFIIARERMKLYDALRKALLNEPDCEVIIDRRAGERGDRIRRRGGGAPGGTERRARHRRERIPVDKEIRECGWAVVKITTWPEADAPRRGA